MEVQTSVQSVPSRWEMVKYLVGTVFSHLPKCTYRCNIIQISQAFAEGWAHQEEHGKSVPKGFEFDVVHLYEAPMYSLEVRNAIIVLNQTAYVSLISEEGKSVLQISEKISLLAARAIEHSEAIAENIVWLIGAAESVGRFLDYVEDPDK